MYNSAQEANDAFYRAFQDLDAERMFSIWSGRASDLCVHPGWPPLRGPDPIAQSWRDIFTNMPFVRIRIDEVSIHQVGEMARVHCIENLFAVIEDMTLHSQVACTNLYEAIDGKWQMVLHHGSPIGTPHAAGPLDA